MSDPWNDAHDWLIRMALEVNGRAPLACGCDPDADPPYVCPIHEQRPS